MSHPTFLDTEQWWRLLGVAQTRIDRSLIPATGQAPPEEYGSQEVPCKQGSWERQASKHQYQPRIYSWRCVSGCKQVHPTGLVHENATPPSFLRAAKHSQVLKNSFVDRSWCRYTCMQQWPYMVIVPRSILRVLPRFVLQLTNTYSWPVFTGAATGLDSEKRMFNRNIAAPSPKCER